MGPSIDAFFTCCLWMFAIVVPLGIWKLGEIIIWLFTHVRVVSQ